jgi:hypothetical protein
MDKSFEVLLNEYKDRMEMLTDALTLGNIAKIEDYKYVCGQLRGLEAACAIIVDLQKRMENSDE